MMNLWKSLYVGKMNLLIELSERKRETERTTSLCNDGPTQRQISDPVVKVKAIDS